MPSKRDLLERNTPYDGPNWSEFQWDRILAFVGGVVITVLYLWVNPSQHVPDWTAAALGSVPVGFLFYGFSSQSWQTCAKIATGTAIGMSLGTYF
ncbi:hypothetical protein [Halorubrum sp. FL23]|uniref:hypothetical protein n=1 Tax=Halorubrum sp. FL23 TaxID=3458704 RepID=UPI004034136D